MGDAYDPDLQLKPNHILARKYKIVKKLGEGSFGAVYEAGEVKCSWTRCRSREVKEHRALKIESLKSPDHLLKVDAHVLMEVAKRNPHPKHLCELFATGKTNRFSFVLMTMLGPSLEHLKKNLPRKHLTVSTGIRIVKECVKALQEVHCGGFVHRDVKPENFAIGATPQTSRTVFIFDFGLARQFLVKDNRGKDKVCRPAREKDRIAFRGTVRYASINAHEDKELGRHDDLISVLYMLVELVSQGGKLPWHDMQDNDQEVEVKKCKKRCRETLYKPFEKSLLNIQEYLYSLQYDDRPDYGYVEKSLDEIINRRKFAKEPYDWEDPETALSFNIYATKHSASVFSFKKVRKAASVKHTYHIQR